MCKKLQPRRGQHPGERFLLGCENSVFVLGISYPTLSIGKSPNYSRIWLDPENVPKRRGRHKGITHCANWSRAQASSDVHFYPRHVYLNHFSDSLHFQRCFGCWCREFVWTSLVLLGSKGQENKPLFLTLLMLNWTWGLDDCWSHLRTF